MDLGGLDPARLAADYALRYRADHSDDEIRAALLGQGFAAEAVEEGLRRAGPRAAPPAAAASPAPPAGRSLLKKIAIGAAVAAGCAALAFAALLGHAVKRKRARPPLPPELAAYRPAPLSDPAHLPAFLPAGLEDADAGEDYARIIAARLGALKEPGGRARLPEQGRALSESEAALLDSALRKARCSLYGVHTTAPATFGDYLDYVAVMSSFQLAAHHHLREPALAARARKDWAASAELDRRLTLFGWHMAQDWEVTTQLLGVTSMIGGILGQSIARKSASGDVKDLDAAKAALDVKAYAPDGATLQAIAGDASAPSRVSALAARLADAPSRRALRRAFPRPGPAPGRPGGRLRPAHAFARGGVPGRAAGGARPAPREARPQDRDAVAQGGIGGNMRTLVGLALLLTVVAPARAEDPDDGPREEREVEIRGGGIDGEAPPGRRWDGRDEDGPARGAKRMMTPHSRRPGRGGREMDPAMKKRFERAREADEKARELSRKLRKAKGSEKDKLKKEAKEALGELFDARLDMEQAMVDKLSEQLAEKKEKLAKKKAARERLVQERLDKLSGDAPSWDD